MSSRTDYPENYAAWQNDPCPLPWSKSGYNPRVNYSVLRYEEHSPLDWCGALMVGMLMSPVALLMGYFVLCVTGGLFP